MSKLASGRPKCGRHCACAWVESQPQNPQSKKPPQALKKSAGVHWSQEIGIWCMPCAMLSSKAEKVAPTLPDKRQVQPYVPSFQPCSQALPQPWRQSIASITLNSLLCIFAFLSDSWHVGLLSAHLLTAVCVAGALHLRALRTGSNCGSVACQLSKTVLTVLQSIVLIIAILQDAALWPAVPSCLLCWDLLLRPRLSTRLAMLDFQTGATHSKRRDTESSLSRLSSWLPVLLIVSGCVVCAMLSTVMEAGQFGLVQLACAGTAFIFKSRTNVLSLNETASRESSQSRPWETLKSPPVSSAAADWTTG